MANPLMPVSPGPASGLRLAPLNVMDAAGAVTPKLFRGFGNKAGTSAGLALDNNLAHMAVAETVDDAWKITGTLTVASSPTPTPAQILVTPLANRKGAEIKNPGSNSLFLGPDNNVRADDVTLSGSLYHGIEIKAGQSRYFGFGVTLAFWLVMRANQAISWQGIEYA